MRVSLFSQPAPRGNMWLDPAYRPPKNGCWVTLPLLGNRATSPLIRLGPEVGFPRSRTRPNNPDPQAQTAMSSQPEFHTAVHLRCFLCDHELPETDRKPPPHPVVSRKFSDPRLVRASRPNVSQSSTMDVSTWTSGARRRSSA